MIGFAEKVIAYMLPDDLMREFLETWQTKRDGTKRGIVEIRP
jgi:hypothetical protein